jgi:putative heme-binding domain-containing protein
MKSNIQWKISCLLFGLSAIATNVIFADEPKRVPWTTSRVEGSPEPPHPYRVERAFSRLSFQNPLLLTMPPLAKDSPVPGANRFFVGEQGGKIFSFPNDQSCEKKDLFLDVATELSSDKETIAGLDALYGLVFHPKYAENRFCYICYVVRGKNPGQVPEGTRVSRFRVTDSNPPRCDPKSEKILLTWRGGGHNGGDLHFGNDGYLYISTGDATDPIPPDGLNTGQDISDLLSSILRIDVDKEDQGSNPKRNYAIPPDNPFLKTPKARPEVWAYGFRNPWRMSFDRPTGDLWVGDVGWELWEMIYRVKSGGNYGWSVMEGPQPVRPDSLRGPTPISPPAIALEHTEAASITGGVVYRGKRLKELYGTYIFGDWVTRKLWGTKFDGEKKVSHQEIAQGNQRVIAFGVDQDQELYFLHHEEVGTLHQLVPNEAVKSYRPNFPRKLSETGIFTTVGSKLGDQVPSPGVYPFTINAQRWSDHAVAERFVAFPGPSSAKVYDGFVPIPEVFFSGQVFLPKNGVLVKTLSMDMAVGDPSTRRRLETQLLHFDGKNWNAYTYGWNDAQTDADLVPASGMDRAISVVDPEAPGGKRQQTWHYPSRAQCITCHNPWVGYALAFHPLQLRQPSANGTAKGKQIDGLTQLKQLGLIELYQANGNKKIDSFPPVPSHHQLANPHDTGASLADRARSYLHVNCSHCHQPNAGGSVVIDLRKSTPDGETKTLGVNPVQGAFNIPAASIISPGDPYRSTLYYRMAKTGPGHMPHIGSELVDSRGLGLVRDWIERIATDKKDPEGYKQHQLLMDQWKTMLSTDPSKKTTRKEALSALLGSTSGALMVASAFDQKEAKTKITDELRTEILVMAKASENAGVRDLFERFMPEGERIKRLGTTIVPERLLALKGDVAKGRDLFFKAGGLQCASCHKIQGTGSTLGPDLSGIGKKYSRAQILESILQPSKSIEPKYATYLVETQDGKVVSGLLASKTDKEVVIRTAQDKEIRLDPKQIVSMDVQKTSQMPEMLLRDLTPEQAISLIDFLASLQN